MADVVFVFGACQCSSGIERDSTRAGVRVIHARVYELFAWDDGEDGCSEHQYGRVWVERHAVQDASRRFHAEVVVLKA